MDSKEEKMISKKEKMEQYFRFLTKDNYSLLLAIKVILIILHVRKCKKHDCNVKDCHTYKKVYSLLKIWDKESDKNENVYKNENYIFIRGSIFHWMNCQNKKNCPICSNVMLVRQKIKEREANKEKEEIIKASKILTGFKRAGFKRKIAETFN